MWNVHSKMPNRSKAQVAAFSVDLVSMVLLSIRTAKVLSSSTSRLKSDTTWKCMRIILKSVILKCKYSDGYLSLYFYCGSSLRDLMKAIFFTKIHKVFNKKVLNVFHYKIVSFFFLLLFIFIKVHSIIAPTKIL